MSTSPRLSATNRVDSSTIPGISAGSNHVGANETCTPQVTCPSGPVLLAAPGAAIIVARKSKTQTCSCEPRLQLEPRLLFREEPDECAGASPTSLLGMAFPLRSRGERHLFQLRPEGQSRRSMRNGYLSLLPKAGRRSPAFMLVSYRFPCLVQEQWAPVEKRCCAAVHDQGQDRIASVCGPGCGDQSTGGGVTLIAAVRRYSAPPNMPKACMIASRTSVVILLGAPFLQTPDFGPPGFLRQGWARLQRFTCSEMFCLL